MFFTDSAGGELMGTLLTEAGDDLLLESGDAITLGAILRGYAKLTLNRKAPIDIGDRAIITARFYDETDTLTDPEDVTFVWRTFGGTETSYTWAASSLVEQTSTGVFVFLAPTVDQVGAHYCRVVSVGGIAAADVVGVGVRANKFTTI